MFLKNFIQQYQFKLLQPLAVSYYFTVYMIFLSGDRNLVILPVLVMTSFVLDSVIKTVKSKKLEYSLPGITTGIAIALLLRAPGYSWPYFFALIFAILSKHIFKDNNGHFINPAAFGIIACLTLFPEHSNIFLAQWPLNIYFYISFLIVAIIVSTLNKKIVLSISYLVGIIIFRILWAKVTGSNLTYAVGVIASIGTLIFSFHMITDPKTSPSSYRGQIIFGLIIASVDFVLRLIEIPFSAILSLCLVSAMINPFVSDYKLLSIFKSK